MPTPTRATSFKVTNGSYDEMLYFLKRLSTHCKYGKTILPYNPNRNECEGKTGASQHTRIFSTKKKIRISKKKIKKSDGNSYVGNHGNKRRGSVVDLGSDFWLIGIHSRGIGAYPASTDY